MNADWIKYANQGATRSLPLSPELVAATQYLAPLGVTMEVFSGGQPGISEGGARVGSTRHDHGNAADVVFYKDGRMLDWNNPADLPVFQEIVARGRAAGLTGFGAGDGYMRPGSMHIGFGNEGVWGAGGAGANAPDWLRSAFYGADQGASPSIGGAAYGQGNALGGYPAPQMGRQQTPQNALAMAPPQIGRNMLDVTPFLRPARGYL